MRWCQSLRWLLRPDDIAGLAIEQFEVQPGRAAGEGQEGAEGLIRFYHANGTHDDRFWSIVLAVAASMEDDYEPTLVVARR